MPIDHPRLTYASLPVMIWTAGPQGACDFFNQRWLEFTGRGLEEEVGFGWADRLHPDDRERALSRYRQAVAARHPFEMEYRLLRHDGEYRWLLDTAVPQHREDGELLGFIGCCTDVTERRALEQRLAQLERFEAIGHLAGGIAHDFNNLLTGILGHVALLREDDGIGTEAREDLDQIHDSAERAASLTRQLLAFGRRQVLSPRILQLSRLVIGSLQAIRRTAGERIEVFHQLDPALDRVLADPGQLEGALLQLCARARDAMPAGGRLEITTAPVEVNLDVAARHPGLRPGAYATVVVRDSGPALEPETLAHIFDPFFRTEPVGPGANLGLASVYGVVKQSGGYIAVTSQPDAGTAFTLYFPRFPEGAEAGAGLPGRDQTEGSETVILVEDEQQVRDLARRVLERAGYTVLAATDADSAVALADRHPGFIHLLITDMVLPRVSGRELAARLSIHRPAIKVLYISGTSDDTIARHRLLEPDTQFLEKPFGLDRLLHKVRQILGPVEGGRPTREILDRTP